MKKIIIVIITAFISCNSSKTETPKQSGFESKIDNSKIAVITYTKKKYNWLFATGKNTELTQSDFIVIENVLKESIEEYNPKQEKRFAEITSKHPEYELEKKNFVISLERYKRQYIAIINEKGEKEVWVNCFCDEKKYWKKDIVFVDDGGNCFFSLKINITKRKYYELQVNGSA